MVRLDLATPGLLNLFDKLSYDIGYISRDNLP